MSNQASSTKQAFPDLIDNMDGNTLSQALKTVLKAQSGNTPYNEVCIATAFFTSAGFFQIADKLKNINSVRLMIGSEFFFKNLLSPKPVGETTEEFQKKQLEKSLKFSESIIQEGRNHLPFNFETENKIKNFVKALKASNIEIRRYEKDFLHAKAYIFFKNNLKKGGIIVGSANMTKSGMTTNLELSTSRSNEIALVKAKAWFNKLWEDALPFDLSELFSALLETRTPFEIFIRVLWELYGKEVDIDSQKGESLPLTHFQKHGVIRALRIMEECGGVIVADEVGLGKTFIAGEIIKIYQSKRQRVLLICPASLRDSTWKKFIHEYKIFLEYMSYEELARDQQLNQTGFEKGAAFEVFPSCKIDKENKNLNKASINNNKINTSEKLARKLDEYQLVIVDEAHNYRNPSAPSRAGILRKLLFGHKKNLLLLTATPVNNSLWDLYNLIHFFIKQDAFMAKKGILSIKELFRSATQDNPTELSPEKLFPIIDATTVKRTRQFVQKHYQNDIIETPDGKTQKIIFPKPKPITVRYSLDKMLNFEDIENALDPESGNKISFSRYTPEVYLKNPDEEHHNMAEGIAGLLRSGLLKRFESSLFAFSNTLNRMIEQHKIFLKSLEQGKVISTQFLQELSGDDETALEELLRESSHTKNVSDYHSKRLEKDVKKDLKTLNQLKKLANQVTAKKDQKLKSIALELKKIS